MAEVVRASTVYCYGEVMDEAHMQECSVKCQDSPGTADGGRKG